MILEPTGILSKHSGLFPTYEVLAAGHVVRVTHIRAKTFATQVAFVAELLKRHGR